MKIDRINRKNAKTQLLEQKYQEIIEMMPISVPEYRDNLEQPPARKVVASVVVYGAYEDPI
jgi:hypothetical protein